MRILFWTEQYWPYIGGLEVIATRLATQLARRGHDVTVVTGHGSLELPDRDEHEGVPVHRFRFFDAVAKGNVELLFETRARLAQLKKSVAPQLVHVNIVGPSVFFQLQTAAVAPSPMLVTQQLAALPGQTGGRDTILGKVLASADWIACCSQSMLDETHNLVPSTAPRTSIIYNAVDMPAIDPCDPPHPARLLCVGRLVAAKGFDVMLRALPAIRSRYPGARLVIAGDGPARGDLEALRDQLGLGDSVHLAGWVAPQRIGHLINDAAIVVIPSRAEAFGLVALEAALMGRPVVASRVGGLPEVVQHQQTGVLVPVDEVDALASAVNALIADPARYAALGDAARLRAEGRFTWESYVDQYEALYERLTSGALTRSSA